MGVLTQTYAGFPATKAKLLMTDTEVVKAVARGKTILSTEAVRLCYMFNKVSGHKVAHASTGSKTGSGGEYSFDTHLVSVHTLSNMK